MANKGLGRGFAALMGMNDIDELTQPQQQQNADGKNDKDNEGKLQHSGAKVRLLSISPNELGFFNPNRSLISFPHAIYINVFCIFAERKRKKLYDYE